MSNSLLYIVEFISIKTFYKLLKRQMSLIILFTIEWKLFSTSSIEKIIIEFSTKLQINKQTYINRFLIN